MSEVTIAVNLRPLYPGRIGGHEMYVRILLDQWIAGPEPAGISWILFTNEANHDTFGHLAGRCRRILLPNADYESFLFSQLVQLRPNLYFCPLLTLEPLNAPGLSAIAIPDLQHEFFPQFFSQEVLQWRRSTFAASAAKAACVFTHSEFSKRTFVEKLGISAEKIHAIYHSVDEVFRSRPAAEQVEAVLQKHGLPRPYVFYPANFWPHKNHERLFEAMARLHKAGSALPLVLTGAEDERMVTLRALARRLGIESLIHYAGYVPKEDLPCIYRGAAALVFPSLFEGFGFPIVEAFCCECPVICSNTTSCPEIAEDAAVLVDPEDVDSIAAAIDQVVRDQRTRERLVQAGSRIAGRYATDQMAQTTLQHLLAAIARHDQEEVPARPLPRISVVTPSFDQGEFIRATIDSVLTQEYPDLEYWVIDGGSSDDTVRILESYGSRLLWISEKDAGQADAVNKGLARATGDIIGWLNSDDTFLDGTLRYIGEFFADHPEVDVVYGDGYYIDRDGRTVQPYHTLDFRWESLAHECYICQPTVFFRRRTLDEVGRLDPNLRIALDYDLWLRLFRRYPPVRLPRFLATSRMYAENKTLSQRTIAYREIISTVRKHFGYVPYSWVFGYASYWWHRNDQYSDPRRTTKLVVLLALLMMGWINRSNPRYLWRWLNDRQYGMRSEVLRSMRSTSPE
jgi:glycosyltransferase involved in cell wall biosynthesis